MFLNTFTVHIDTNKSLSLAKKRRIAIEMEEAIEKLIKERALLPEGIEAKIKVER